MRAHPGFFFTRDGPAKNRGDLTRTTATKLGARIRVRWVFVTRMVCEIERFGIVFSVEKFRDHGCVLRSVLVSFKFSCACVRTVSTCASRRNPSEESAVATAFTLAAQHHVVGTSRRRGAAGAGRGPSADLLVQLDRLGWCNAATAQLLSVRSSGATFETI